MSCDGTQKNAVPTQGRFDRSTDSCRPPATGFHHHLAFSSHAPFYSFVHTTKDVQIHAHSTSSPAGSCLIANNTTNVLSLRFATLTFLPFPRKTRLMLLPLHLLDSLDFSLMKTTSQRNRLSTRLDSLISLGVKDGTGAFSVQALASGPHHVSVQKRHIGGPNHTI